LLVDDRLAIERESERMWNEIAGQIGRAIDKRFEIVDRRSVGGGCINQAYIISSKTERYFIKLNQASRVEMFAAEAKGLQEMAATITMKVPLPICWGMVNESSYLVLECLDLTSRGNSSNWAEMGRNLAAMHDYRMSNTPQFGWHINNTIGSTPQLNTWENDWAIFFKNHRLGYQQS
jgi:fructosamine-3-kinase